MEGADNETCVRENNVEHLLVVFLAVTLEKIFVTAGFAANDEVINLFQEEKFNRSGFKQMIKTSGGCQVISQDVIDRYKEW